MDLVDAVETVLSEVGRTRATDAEVVAAEGETLEVGVRLGSTEKLKRARERRIAIRLFAGSSSAVCSTADLTPEALRCLVRDCFDLARVTAPDPLSALPDATETSAPATELDLYDPAVAALDAEEALGIAMAAERAALDSDPAITNSEGAEFETGTQRILYRTSRGIATDYATTSLSLSVVPVARRDGSMQQDYWYSAVRKKIDLEPPETVGRIAATRALRRLGARSVRTCEVPVVFDPQMAATILGHFAAAASGSSIYRGLSFLQGRLGEEVAASSITLVDDPLLPSRLGSRPFDAEGLPTRRNVVVEQGVLRTYLLDTYAARKLGLQTTASAVRSFGDVPSAGPSNFFLANGSFEVEQIIGSIERGLYVTELSGFGVNPVTGDYSRGAVGIWIEGGRLTFPVEEVTIAGNLLEMLRNVEMIGNDLHFRGRFASPTLKIARMTVAGEG
jgi:PmbA protein